MSKLTRTENFLRSKNIQFSRLSALECSDYQQRWRNAFASKLFAEKGVWIYRGYDWHIFSYEIVNHLRKDQAQSAYRRIDQSDYLILPNLKEDFGYRCSGKLPDLSGKFVDFYVCSCEMTWTMVFDHESIGPFFCSTELLNDA